MASELETKVYNEAVRLFDDESQGLSIVVSVARAKQNIPGGDSVDTQKVKDMLHARVSKEAEEAGKYGFIPMGN